mgnify:CR=1 FL=1
MSRALGGRPGMGAAAIRADRTDLSARVAYEACRQRQAAGHLLETYGDTLGTDATWMRGDEATEGLLLPSHLSATIATAIPEAIAAAGHSRDAGHGDCARMLRKVRACRTPDGRQAVPAQRRVSTLRGKLGIDPMDLSLLEGQAGVPT